ncbi:TPA_asm: L [Baccharis alphacytorhabdovirus 1]|nr:TPA_asm: L [Baccharis alphacytorhabdovirus 1]
MQQVDYLFDEIPVQSKKRYDPLPDFHLQNPLYSIKTQIAQWEQLKRNRKVRKLPVRVFKSLNALSTVGPRMTEGNPILLRELIESHSKFLRHPLPLEIIDDVSRRLKWDLSDRVKLDCTIFKDAWDYSIQSFPVTLWNLMREGQELLSSLNALSSRRPLPVDLDMADENLYFKRLGSLRIIITPSYLGILDREELYVFDSDWLRSVCDIWTERFLIILSARIGKYMSDDHYPDIKSIRFIFAWGDRVLKDMGNNGFKLLKAYEALVLGVLQKQGKGTFVSNDRFLNNTLTDLSSENSLFGAAADSLVKYLEQMESPHHTIQLYGLHRIWGHPIVNPGKGMEKMLIIGQKDIVEDGKLPNKLGDHFKKMFCKSFRDKTGLYPPLEPVDSVLYELLSNQADWTKCNVHSMEGEWSRLKFAKAYEIPESFNLSMIVADKSVSPSMTELKGNIAQRESVMNAELRRGVLKWINNDTIDPKPFLEDVNAGKFPQDHKIIGLRSKEREMNPVPRMFALMSHLMRVYVVITESMLSDHILPHFPQITMTDDLLSLTKKTYTTVKQQSGKRGPKTRVATKTVCMSLDFEKWNGHMRQESTLHVFKCLGQLFGMENLYHVTYDIFKESYFYLADGSYIPRIAENGDFIPEPPLSFTGHKGGQEGLRQKGWTIFTVVGLDMICSRHNCQYKIMGMGDNQVLQLTFFTHKVSQLGEASEEGLKDMQRELNGVFSDLLETFNSLGLPLKPLETWISEDLFVYGKYPVWQGVPLTMDLKKIMRIFPFSNQELMTTENILNTIAGNAQAATQAAPHLGPSYVTGLFMLYLAAEDMLNYHPLIGKGLLSCASSKSWGIKIGSKRYEEIPLDAHDIPRWIIRNMMVLVPRILGGYVSFTLFGLLMRGFPDPLSLALSQLYHYRCHQADQGVLQQLLRRWMNPIFMPDRSFKLLTEDVSSVNLLAPVTPTAGLRREVEKFLSEGRSIKNQEFKDLMGVRNEIEEEILAEHLCTGDTLHIRLIHDILEATIYGYVKSIVSKVTNSSTILSLVVDKAKSDPLSKVIDGEENYFKFFLWRNKHEGSYVMPECPTELCKMMRRDGWKKNLVGVTVAFPMSYLSQTHCFLAEDNCNCKDGFISLYTNDSSEPPTVWNRSIGGNPPYLGSMTREKLVISSGMKIYSGEPLIKRPINLLRVIGWFVPEESNTAEILRSCVAAVSDLNPDDFRGVSEGISGSEIHRYKDSSLKHGALCSSNYLYSTRYHVSTDTFSRYAKGAQNYDMMFQANLCSIIEIMHINLITALKQGEKLSKTYHFRQTCYSCISPLDETFHDIESDRVSMIVPSKKSNKHLFVPAAKVSLTYHSKPFTSWVDDSFSSTDFNRMPMHVKITLFHETMVDNICMDIMNSGEELTYLTTSLLDIKEHNRLFYLTASPKAIFDDLCSRIYLMAEWRCLVISDWRVPTEESLERTAVALISNCKASNLAGMAGFFTWKESMKTYYCYPEIVEPDTIPVSVESACKAIKISLINLLSSSRVFNPSRQTHILLEETKSSKLVLKMMIYDQLKRSTNRWCCLRAVAKITPHDLALTTPVSIICSEHHQVFPQGFGSLIQRSQISMDALKKSLQIKSSKDSIPRTNMIPALTRTTVQTVFDSRHCKANFILNSSIFTDEAVEVCPIIGVDLMKVFALPTNAKYKYLDVLSYVIKELESLKYCFLLGNGLGGTSEVLSKLWGGEIILSTLLETGDAIPQSYPHANVPFKFSTNPNINSDCMININNDITSKEWTEGWHKQLPMDMEFCLSDIEISHPDSSDLRDVVVDKLTRLRKWKMMVIKDYIYSKGELNQRLAIVSKASTKFQLVVSTLRQRTMPECWWIVERLREDRSGKPLYYASSILDTVWRDFKSKINSDHFDSKPVLREINVLLNTEDQWFNMLGRVRAWSTLPIVGSALPYNGTYTRLFGYLQKGKKPIEVKPEFDDSSRKLYAEDYDRVRSVLLGLAASMIGPIEEREKFIQETHLWRLDWKPNVGGKWEPFLIKRKKRTLTAMIYDVVPMLSVIMFREKLVFKKVESTIKFKHSRKRNKLCFPITKAAALRDL